MPFFYSTNTSWNVSSNINRNGQMSSHTYSEQTRSTPDGTTVRTAYQRNDDPVQFTEKRYGSAHGRVHISSDHSISGRIEDVTDQEHGVSEQRVIKEAPAAKKDEPEAKKE